MLLMKFFMFETEGLSLIWLYCRANIQLSTLVKLFNGLGRQISVRVV